MISDFFFIIKSLIKLYKVVIVNEGQIESITRGKLNEHYKSHPGS